MANLKEDLSSKTKSKVRTKNTAAMEAPTRTLRPRKVSASSEPVKQKPVTPSEPVKGVKGKPVKTTKVVASTKKESAGKTRKTKAEKNSEEGNSPPKLKKIEVEPDEKNKDDLPSTSSIYDFKAKTIQGKEISLGKYKGHVCVIVNVASKCGHTASNYKELVELYDKYSESEGLRILAFPCNQFGKQEPGDNEKICEFAKKRNVNFDMFEKINVNGKDAHPLWKFLTSQKDGPKGAKIDWNFTKFLIGKDGQVVERFKPTVKPLSLVEELEKLW